MLALAGLFGVVTVKLLASGCCPSFPETTMSLPWLGNAGSLPPHEHEKRSNHFRDGEYFPLHEELEHRSSNADADLPQMGDKYAGLHHAWFRFGGQRMGSEGLKDALIAYSNIWGVGAALVMTVCFSLLMHKPDIDESIPFVHVAVHLFYIYNVLAVCVSIKAVREIAYVQEDINFVPPGLTSEYLTACEMSGGIVGPACSHGPHRWTTLALSFQRSAGMCLVYVMHGPLVGAYAFVIFAFVHSTDVTTGNARIRMWRSLEFATWRLSSMKPEIRQQAWFADDLSRWHEGKGHMWLKQPGFPVESCVATPPNSQLCPPPKQGEPHPPWWQVGLYWTLEFPIDSLSHLLSLWHFRILAELAFGGSHTVKQRARQGIAEIARYRKARHGATNEQSPAIRSGDLRV